MSTVDRKQILIICEKKSDCPQKVLEELENAGFQISVQITDTDVGLADHLSSAREWTEKIRNAGDWAGLLGIGYGGAVAGHLLAESDTFNAAVLISALINPATAYGTGTGIRFPETGKNFSMMEYLSKLSDASVVQYCDEIHTPVLFLHGLKDTVYGYEQSEQLFTALKERHPESAARMVLFPEAGHGLLKSVWSIRCIKEMVNWFTAKRCGGGNFG